MKKILKNKKGFTLVELLAVIVVLAIIMVIATQQVSNTIKKSRANSYFETVQSIRKGMQTACANDNSVNGTTIEDYVEYSDVTVKYVEASDTKDKEGNTVHNPAHFEISPSDSGKFKNMDINELSKNANSIYTISNTTVTFNSDC